MVTQSVTGIIPKEGHEFKKMKRKAAKKKKSSGQIILRFEQLIN